MHRPAIYAKQPARRGRVYTPPEAAPITAQAANAATPAAIGAVVSTALHYLPAIINLLSAAAGFVWLCIQIYESPTRAHVAACIRKRWRRLAR